MTSGRASFRRFSKQNSHAAKRVGGAIALVLILGGCAPCTETPPNATVTAPANNVAAGNQVPTGPTDGDTALVDAITVVNDPAGQPQLEFTVPSEVSATTLRVYRDGTGAALQNGYIVTLHAATWRGDNGELLFSTWEDDSPESFILGGGQFEIISNALQGKHVGAQIIIANPTTFQDESYTVFSIFEVINASPPRAAGSAVEVDPSVTLPVVTLAANGEPSIEFPENFTAPDELVVQTLIQGDGATVRPDSMITIHYTGWLLNGEVFDSSWGSNPAVFPLQALIAGWQEGLAGQQVGSQVLLVVPPELGYGPNDSGPIPGNSTLVFVVDILGAN